MTYTQAQIDKANAVDLEKFLRAQGETLVRSGKEYRWKAHDSLTACGNKWFRHSQSKGGWLSGGFRDGILRQVLPRSGADADRRAGRSPAGG